MGAVRPTPLVKLFCALLLAPEADSAALETALQHGFGRIVLRSEPFSFTQTSYYEREMGQGLQRLYVAFEPLVCRGELAAIKHTTNRLEASWTRPTGQRRVNVDPGYLDLGKVVLVSTKDHAHRLYIGAGMFAEVTLHYSNKRFQPWDWTYPDYRLASTQAFFARLRALYRADLRR